MYQKNVASQGFGFAMNTTLGEADPTATVTVYVSKAGGTQATGGGSVTNLGNGQYWYAMTQAETNTNFASFLLTAFGDVPVEKTLLFTAANPTDGVRFGLTALPNLVAGVSGGLPLSGDAVVLPAIPTDWITNTGIHAAALDGKGDWIGSGGTINPVDLSKAGLAQAADSTTITLSTNASAVDDFYNTMTVVIVSGTGAGQQRVISGYVGVTQVATVPAWAVIPDNTSSYMIVG